MKPRDMLGEPFPLRCDNCNVQIGESFGSRPDPLRTIICCMACAERDEPEPTPEAVADGH